MKHSELTEYHIRESINKDNDTVVDQRVDGEPQNMNIGMNQRESNTKIQSVSYDEDICD